MTSHVFWPFFTYLVLLYNVQFWGLSWTPLPTLISDVINGRSHMRHPVSPFSSFYCLSHQIRMFDTTLEYAIV